MSQTRQRLSEMLQKEVELQYFISTFYTSEGLKDLDNETLESRGEKLESHVFTFSLSWLNLSSIGVKVRSEDVELQKEIQDHVDSLKATCNKVTMLYSDISKLQLSLDVKELYESTQKIGLPVIYDFTSIEMPSLAVRVMAGATLMFGLHHSTKIMLSQLESIILESDDEEVLTPVPNSP